jgi:hypothetical protein
MVAATLTTTQPLAWTDAVQRVSEMAHAKMPVAMHGAIERATALVLDGRVWLEEDGHALVRNSEGVWMPVNGSCPCPASTHHPEQPCKHRLAVGIYKRAAQLMHEPLTATVEEDAPALNPEHVVTIQGRHFVKYAGLLALAQARGLVRLEARFISVTAEMALAEATATFADGRVFSEAADATPGNVGKQVAPHFARMALTRSKARCLRDALGVDLCAVEELGE